MKYQKFKLQNTNTKYQTNPNDQNSKPIYSMILKKEQSNDLVIGYWNLKFFNAFKVLSHKCYNIVLMNAGIKNRVSCTRLSCHDGLDGALDIRILKRKTVFQQPIGDGALTAQKNVAEFTHR